MQPIRDRSGVLTLDDARKTRGIAHSRRTFGLDPDTIKWYNTIRNPNGGVLERPHLTIADGLLRSLKATGFYDKIVTLWPFLGTSENSWAQPLVDKLSKGKSGVTSFVDGDYSLSGGLQGDGAGKYLDTNTKPNELGSSNNGGLGWFDLDVDTSGATYALLGSDNAGDTNYFTIRTHPFPQSDFIWGQTANAAVSLSAYSAGVAHWYGQRSSATSRELFLDGSSVATNTTSDATSGAGDRNIILFGWNVSSVQTYKGRCGCAYFTDGTLTSDEVVQMHRLLIEKLMKPCGRVYY